MDQPVELEVCANCKREIPHYNYVMHTAHCARNITLCPGCKEPIPKGQFAEHKQACGRKPQPKPAPPPTAIEQSKYFVAQKTIQDQRVQQRQEKRLQRLEKLVDASNVLGHAQQNGAVKREDKPKQSLLPCQYCELELPKEDLGEHENYCGARTEKCSECGELVMFKYRQLHQDSNHGFLKLNDEPGPKASWDAPRRTSLPDSPTRRRPAPRPFTMFDMSMYSYAPAYSPTGSPTLSTVSSTGEKLETSKELSRRLDCKTEYIRNLLHDSASITAPLRSTGAVRKHKKDEAYEGSSLVNSALGQAGSAYLGQASNALGQSNDDAGGFNFGIAPSSFLDMLNNQDQCCKPGGKCKPTNPLANNILGQAGTVLGRANNADAVGALAVNPSSLLGLINADQCCKPGCKPNCKPKANKALGQGQVLGRANNPGLAFNPVNPSLLGLINQGPAPQPPRRNPPTELVIPCEFCNVPVPHSELIEHETGCRPDLARFIPRRGSSPDFFMAPEPSSPDVELPCEFCADLIPASRLLSHQATCN